MMTSIDCCTGNAMATYRTRQLFAEDRKRSPTKLIQNEKFQN